jgi:TldD protein
VDAFGQSLVLDDDVMALRTSIWMSTDAAYRAATAALEQKATQRASERELEARPFDFAPQKPTQLVEADPEPLPATAELERLVSVVSKEFQAFPEVHESVVTAAAWRIRRTLMTSEGTLVVTPTQVVEVTIECNTQADDGMPLDHEVTLFGDLDEGKLRDTARRLAAELTELRHAPLAPDYYGPVLFTGVAAPQIVQELLANSVVGTPVPGEGPWARRLQRRVLPESVDLVSDPTLEEYRNQPLMGGYAADDEGTPAQKVTLVERGFLKTLLMSRTPSRDIGASNGHGRTGYAGWARGAVANLILSTRVSVPLAKQRRQMLAGGPNTGQGALEVERLSPREFATNGGAPPTVERAYLVSPEGKRTLVRGVNLSEMQVRDLKDLISVGSEPTVYHVLQNAGGFSIPTSFVAPALLFEEIEVKKPKESPALPKFLPKHSK